MPPVLIPKVHEMVLPDVGPVAVPEPIAHLKCFEAAALRTNRSRLASGNVRHLAPSDPGTLPLRLRLRFLPPKCSKKFKIKAGDAVVFPPNSQGVWDVRETIRKSYVTFNY